MMMTVWWLYLTYMVKLSDNLTVNVGVQLIRGKNGVGDTNDAFYIFPALLVAQQHAMQKFGVTMIYQLNWYSDDGKCNDTVATELDATRGALALLNGERNPRVTWYSDIATIVAISEANQAALALKNQYILGPACTEQFKVATLATSSLETPALVLSGQAALLFCTDNIILTIRTSYNAYNMWYILTSGLATLFDWTHFACISDQEDTSNTQYCKAMGIIATGGKVEECDPPFYVAKMRGQSVKECPCNWLILPGNAMNPVYNETALLDCLECASKDARIVVLAASAPRIRALLLVAYKYRDLYLNEEFAYFTADPYHESFVRIYDKINSIPTPAWKMNDGYDDAAREAFSYMLVIGLESYEDNGPFSALQASTTAMRNSLVSGALGNSFGSPQDWTPPNSHWEFLYVAATYYDAALLLAEGLTDVYADMQSQGFLDKTTLLCNNSRASPNMMAQYPQDQNPLFWTPERCFLYYLFDFMTRRASQSRFSQRFSVTSKFHGSTGDFFLSPGGDRVLTYSLYAMDGLGLYSKELGIYDNNDEKKGYVAMQKIPWKTTDGFAPKNTPTCGYDRKCPPNYIAIGAGVGVTLLLILATLAWHWRRKVKAQAKIDYDWIIPIKQLRFRKKKPADVTLGQHPPSPTESGTDLGNSMGKSMAASQGGSMGASLGASAPISMSMRKRMLAMSDHFGSWNKQTVVVRWTKRKRVVVTPQIVREVRVIRKISHNNVALFLGGCIDEGHVCVLYEMCNKGPLNMMFETEGGVKLDWIILMSWIKDLVNAMYYIHGSPIGPHSRLTSKCCFIDGRFALKVTDYGIPSIFTPTMSETWTAKRSTEFAFELLWTCPEKLRADATSALNSTATKEGDVYSFAIIMQEIILKNKPYCMYNMPATEIVDEVRKGTSVTGQPFRPNIVAKDETPPDLILLCIKCWSEEPSLRPLFDKIRTTIRAIAKDMNMGDNANIMDVFLEQMEESENVLKETIEKKDNELMVQKEQSDRAFTLVFPQTVAELIMNGDDVEPFLYLNATLLRTDVLGFGTICVESKPVDITKYLDDLYLMFNDLTANFLCFIANCQADSLWILSGIFGESARQGARELARLALFSMIEIRQFVIQHRPSQQAKLRIGIASGPLMMSTVNHQAPRYGICGETTQVARRLVHTADQLKIQISATTKSHLDSYKTFVCKLSPVSPILVNDDLKVDIFWLLDEKDNEDLKFRKQEIMDDANDDIIHAERS